jgi:hypothetical protein
MKKIKILLLIVIASRICAKEYSDPLSGVRYEIPDNIPVKTAKAEDDNKPVYMIAYQNKKTQAVIVYSTKLRDPADKRTPENYMAEEGGLDSRRSNRHVTKQSWRDVGGRSYYILEAYDKDGSAYTYFTYYIITREGYAFTICFTTGYNPMQMWDEWDKVVMDVKYPVSK